MFQSIIEYFFPTPVLSDWEKTKLKLKCEKRVQFANAKKYYDTHVFSKDSEF